MYKRVQVEVYQINIRNPSALKIVERKRYFTESSKIYYEMKCPENGKRGDSGRLKMENAVWKACLELQRGHEI